MRRKGGGGIFDLERNGTVSQQLELQVDEAKMSVMYYMKQVIISRIT